jgi:hypothetical protein
MRSRTQAVNEVQKYPQPGIFTTDLVNDLQQAEHFAPYPFVHGRIVWALELIDFPLASLYLAQ